MKKPIDIKSLIAGILLTSVVIFGVAAASKEEQNKAQWIIGHAPVSNLYERPNDPSSKGEKFINNLGQGWEPFAVSGDGKKVFTRKRIK